MHAPVCKTVEIVAIEARRKSRRDVRVHMSCSVDDIRQMLRYILYVANLSMDTSVEHTQFEEEPDLIGVEYILSRLNA